MRLVSATFIRRLFDLLTEPSPLVSDLEGRRKARTLAILSLAAIGSTILSLLLTKEPVSTNTAMIVVSIAFTLFNYGLCRTRYYWIGVFIATTCSVGITLAIVAFVPFNGLAATTFIIPAILLSTLFWSARITALIAVIEIVGALLLARFTPESVPDMYLTFSYLVSIAGFIVLVSALRQHTTSELQARTRELAASEARYRGLFEATPVPLWEEDFSQIRRFLDNLRGQGVHDLRKYLEANPTVIDEAMSHLQILDVNRAALHSVRETDKARLLGNLKGMIQPENRRSFLDQLMAMAAGHTEYQGENRHLTLAGDHNYLNVRWSAMPGYEADLSRAVVQVLDVTDRYEADQQRVELVVERERVAVLQQFISSVHHDLMTPVTALKTGLYLLDKTITDDKQRERIERLNIQVSFLEKLIQDMLMMSRLDKLVQDDLQLHADDLNALINGLVNYYQPIANSKRLKLERDIQSPIPSVRMDTEQLKRAFANLIDNALKFTPEGGTISVVTEQKAGGICVEIRDTGPGVSDDETERIFERFYRGATHRPSDGGTGLGLTISRKIIEAHGGQISVHQAEKGGAIFRVLLPNI